VGSARLIIAHSVGLRVLLADSVRFGRGGELGELVAAFDNFKVGACGVILILAAHGSFGLHAGCPAPDPVDCEGLADLGV